MAFSKRIFIILALSSCKNQNFEAGKLADIMLKPCIPMSQSGFTPSKINSKPLIVYSWTNNAEALTNPELFVRNGIDSGKQSCSFSDSDQIDKNTNRFGEGLYVASDPLTSSSYGKILVKIQLRSGQKKIIFANDSNALKALTSEASIIAYDFGLRFSKRAAVIRSVSEPYEFIVEAVSSIDTRKQVNYLKDILAANDNSDEMKIISRYGAFQEALPTLGFAIDPRFNSESLLPAVAAIAGIGLEIEILGSKSGLSSFKKNLEDAGKDKLLTGYCYAFRAFDCAARMESELVDILLRKLPGSGKNSASNIFRILQKLNMIEGEIPVGTNMEVAQHIVARYPAKEQAKEIVLAIRTMSHTAQSTSLDSLEPGQ